MYRADVTLEVNAPGVEILDEKRREGAGTPSIWDVVTTQAGLLSSRSLAERVAQDLNLAADPNFVGTGGDAASRLREAAGRIQAGLNVEVPEEGQLIKYNFVSDSCSSRSPKRVPTWRHQNDSWSPMRRPRASSTRRPEKTASPAATPLPCRVNRWWL
jgi:hypothetical protein